MKRSLLLGIVAFIIVAAPLAASVITGALYEGAITATNTSYTAQKVSVPFDLGTQGLLDGGYIDSDFSNVALQNSSGEDVAFMPGQSGNPWMMFIPQISQNSALNYSLYTGGTTDMEGDLAYFPGAGGMTVPDDASLEPGDNFEFEMSGYFDTSVTGDIISKTDNFALSSDGGDVVAQITDVEEVLSYVDETTSDGHDKYGIWSDDTHIYVADYHGNNVEKYLKSDLSYIGSTPSYGNYVMDVWGDDTYIYAGGFDNTGGGATVQRYLKSDLSFVDESPVVSNRAYQVWGDDNYIYASGYFTVNKYSKTDLSLVAEGDGIREPYYGLWGDDTHVYAADSYYGNVRKYLISDMSTVSTITLPDGANGVGLVGDNTYIYVGSTNHIYKYLKSDLSLAAQTTVGYGSSIRALWDDGKYIYAGGLTTDSVYRYLKSDLSFVDSVGVGDFVNGLTGDNTYLYAAGGYNTVKRLEIYDYTLISTNANVPAGVHNIKVGADGINLKLYVDGVEVDSTALGGSSVPDNANDWVFFQNSVAPYVYYAKHTVGGSLVGHWYWEYDTTFTDQSGNGNIATPTFRTTTTDADVSAELKSFTALSQSVFDDAGSSEGPEIVTDDDLPPVFSAFYVDLHAEDLPGIGQPVNDFLATRDIPQEIVWLPFVYVGGAVITMFGYRFTRKLLPSAIAGVLWNVFFGVVIGSGLWGLVVIGFISIGEMANRKKVSI